MFTVWRTLGLSELVSTATVPDIISDHLLPAGQLLYSSKRVTEDSKKRVGQHIFLLLPGYFALATKQTNIIQLKDNSK